MRNCLNCLRVCLSTYQNIQKRRNPIFCLFDVWFFLKRKQAARSLAEFWLQYIQLLPWVYQIFRSASWLVHPHVLLSLSERSHIIRARLFIISRRFEVEKQTKKATKKKINFFIFCHISVDSEVFPPPRLSSLLASAIFSSKCSSNYSSSFYLSWLLNFFPERSFFASKKGTSRDIRIF
jgi:hypothetical protein